MKLPIKSIIFPLYLLLFVAGINLSNAQSLSISDCYLTAAKNYPLVKQMDLISKSAEYSVKNAGKGYYPQLAINGQATYQSDVTELPIKLPGLKIGSLSKDQYKLYADVNQTIYDGGIIRNQKSLIETNSAAEVQKTEIEMYKLKERVNQLFFGILLLDGQLVQADLHKKDLQTGIEKMDASFANGIALKSSSDILKAELLKTNQRITELKSARKGFTNMLGLFINQSLDEKSILEMPQYKGVSSTISRPEIKLFELQKSNIEVQNKMISAKNMPKLGVFVQAGYGRPALNFLNNEFAFYYIGGVRLNWSLSGFYTLGKDREIVSLNQKMIDVQKDVFLFNTNLSLSQQNTEVTKAEELIQVDGEIIALRKSIKESAEAQLANGTITSDQFLTQVNAEDDARLNLLLHKIQLLNAQFNIQTTTGN